jgi:transposase InsO family protein
MSLDASAIERVRCDWAAAPAGVKSQIVCRWAGELSCAPGTLYRKLNIGRPRAGGRLIPEIEAFAQVVAQVKRTPPEQMGELTTEQAVRIAADNGLIPAELAGKAGTFDRVMRELGYSRKNRRVVRFQAEYPNQLHHVDASTSKCFYIQRATGDGDYILRLHAGSKNGYKNKPIPTGLRPWVYGLVDDHSGVAVARYIAAFGETALDNLSFLQWAWSRQEERFFFGLPDLIKGDLGPMMRGPAGQDFFARLGVAIDPSTPLNKEAHGKIERPWRTAWQRFEKPFFVQPEWKKFEIRLSELNRRFQLYLEELNDRPHRYEKQLSRRQAWLRINQRGGAVAIPENALATIARRHERRVGVDGCFSIGGRVYEVKGLHDATVHVYEGVFDGRLVVQDQRDGARYEVEDFTPLAVGEFKGQAAMPHQAARREATALTATNTLYLERETGAANVTRFPTRVRETRTIADPMALDSYASATAAMQDFVAISGVVPDASNRDAIRDLISDNGLERAFVRELALEVRSEHERSVMHG